MADQNRDKHNDEDARSASSTRGSDKSNDKSTDRKPSTTNGEPDDVAEDRNLSGASTWLTLPDQPKEDSESTANKSGKSTDQNDRQSNR